MKKIIRPIAYLAIIALVIVANLPLIDLYWRYWSD